MQLRVELEDVLEDPVLVNFVQRLLIHIVRGIEVLLVAVASPAAA